MSKHKLSLELAIFFANSNGKIYNKNMEERIVKREGYLSLIRPFYDSKYIKAITGIRRCGKSELLKQIIGEIKKKGVSDNKIIYLDLEGKSGEGITTRLQLENKLDNLIKDNSFYYIFIDEVQHIKKFEEAIASVRVSYNCSLFVTGSNSKLLSGKLQDRLTGRAKEFKIQPFTYLEYLEYKKINKLPINDSEFSSYLKWGGMPQRFEEIDENGLIFYFNALFKSIVEKDVFGTHKKIDKNDFINLSKYILSSTGRLFSSLAIAKYLKNEKKKDPKIYSQTINNYCEYLKECYFINECNSYYINGRSALKGTRKFYIVDVGLKTALGNFIEFDESFNLETIIYNELIYRGYKVSYGKLYNGEIDFVVQKNNKKCFIQVAEYINKNNFEREYGAYKNITDASPKFVLSLDKKDTSNNGITHLNIEDFLIGKADIHMS